MRIARTKRFKKQFKKLPPPIQDQFIQRLQLLVSDPAAPVLRVHPLKGRYVGYWSMNINGDIRALYRKEGEEIILLAFIGTHSQLYG